MTPKDAAYYTDVILHDEDAQALAPFYLPPAGAHVSAQELKDACERLANATRRVRALRRAHKGRVQ